MKKKFIAIVLSLAVGIMSAQTGKVGINTSSPSTTLDVNGLKDSSGNLVATDAAGLQAPRMTRAELSSKGDALYGANQKGALAYITDVSGGNANLPQRGNITSVGYYYFDGTKWISVASTANISDELAKLNIPQVVVLLSFNTKATPDTEATTYLGADMGSGIRTVKWSNKILDKYNQFDTSTYEFTAQKKGYYSFEAAIAFRNLGTGSTMRLGVSNPYTGAFQIAGNSSFGILYQTNTEFNVSSVPEFIRCSGMVYMNVGEKVMFLTRYIDPTILTLDIDSINYKRQNNDKAVITYFGE